MKAKGRPRDFGARFSGRIWPPRDQKDANRRARRSFVGAPERLMAGFAAEMRDVEGGDGIVGPDQQRFPRRHAPQHRLHTDDRNRATIAGSVEYAYIINGLA